MRKKGQYLLTKKVITSIKTLFILVIGITLILYTLNTAQVSEQKTDKIKYRLYAEQLANTPSCFAYEHPTGRVDQGVIDPAKLDQEHLEACSQLTREAPYRIQPVKVTIIDPRSQPTSLQTSTWHDTTHTTHTHQRDVKLKTPDGTRPSTLIMHFNPR